MIDEPGLEDRLYDRAESVMDDAVAKRRRRDNTIFRIVDFEGFIASRPIFAPAKLSFQGQQLALQIGENDAAPGFLRLPLTVRRAASCKAWKLAIRSNRWSCRRGIFSGQSFTV
jgi:hypothetical protein